MKKNDPIDADVLLRYLPAVYQEDPASKEFLEQLLSIFASVLDESEYIISDIPSYFDPEAVDPPDGHEGFISWLASWLSLDLYELLGMEKNRKYILKAAEFYRQKGTLQGLTDLVKFLTGIDSTGNESVKVKENGNNIFRSYGMEHCHETDCEQDCAKSLRYWSRTVDTENTSLLQDIGTFNDRVHYTWDSSANGRYSPYTVDIYITISRDEKFEILDKNKKQLYDILESFVPVFMKVNLRLLVIESETYPLYGIDENDNGAVNYNDHITIISEEITALPEGSYSDDIHKWVIHTYMIGGGEIENKYRSNDLRYWTYMILNGRI